MSKLILTIRSDRGVFEVGCSNCKFHYYGKTDAFMRCGLLGGCLVNGQFGCKGYKWRGPGTESIQHYQNRLSGRG